MKKNMLFILGGLVVVVLVVVIFQNSLIQDLPQLEPTEHEVQKPEVFKAVSKTYDALKAKKVFDQVPETTAELSKDEKELIKRLKAEASLICQSTKDIEKTKAILSDFLNSKKIEANSPFKSLEIQKIDFNSECSGNLVLSMNGKTENLSF